MFVTGVLAVVATVAGGLTGSHRKEQLAIQTLDLRLLYNNKEQFRLRERDKDIFENRHT
jgi:hypothetical protein